MVGGAKWGEMDGGHRWPQHGRESGQGRKRRDTRAAKNGRNGDMRREAGKDDGGGDKRAAIHGRDEDTGREAGKDDGGGHEGGHTRPQRRHEEEASEDDSDGTRERPRTAATGTRGGKRARTAATGTRQLEAAKNGRFNDAETGGWGYWRSLRASRSMSATGWQLSLRSMLWPVSGV